MSLSFVYPQYLWLLLLVPLTIGLALYARRTQSRRRFWGGLILRSVILIFIIFALAGIQLRLRADTLTAVFILDASDSLSPEAGAQGETFIRQAIEDMPAGDQAAVVVFGEDALVERLATEETFLPGLASVPVTTRTDIAGALQLSLALFPDEGAKRLVLLSDGRENLRQAVEQAQIAAAQGIELLYVPLGELGSQELAEVLIDDLQAPADVRLGERFDLTVVVQSSASQNATLRVFADGNPIWSEEVRLDEGLNRFHIPIEADEPGPNASAFKRFRAQIVPEIDNRLQNNEASAFTVVHGPPRVLLVEGQAGEGENLARALEAAEMQVRRIPPSEIPNSLPELAGYEAVLLVNVHAAALPDGAMQALPIYVRELGKGLVMIGGEDSFGAGGYLRTPLEEALPVSMDVKDKELQANLALVLAVDKSGSMGRCHCDNPDLDQTYTRTEVGQPKVDIAKEAIMRSSSALGPEDYLGVVTFDEQASWLLPVETLVDPLSLEQAIGSFIAEGQTNLRTGVEAAFQALEEVSARRKHIILMTDGWVHEGDLSTLAREMQEQGITLSVVAAGGGSGEYLAGLAQLGGGRYYPATDILNVPDIFLKETVTSVGRYIIEEPFYPLPSAPSPVLRSLDATRLPPLLGYNGATAKNTAREDLITPRGDPLLATWQYGLGRAAAWTSDFKGQWGQEWIAWEDFPRFAAQLVGWTLPAPKAEGLEASVALVDEGGLLGLSAVDQDGRPLNFLDVQATIIGPDLGTSKLALKQSGAGRYEALTDTPQPGTYLVRLGVNDGDQSLGQVTLGLVVPYSPEYRLSGVDRSLLEELARATGGGALSDPLAAFVHNLPSVDYAREIWRPLLLLVALLFPLDIAIRRLTLGPRDLAKARLWLRERLPTRQRGADQRPPVLGRLFEARQRARERSRQPESSDQERPAGPLVGMAGQKPSTPAAAETPPEVEDQPSEATAAPEDSLARLREAKKRARRK